MGAAPETVLLVEDDDDARALWGQALRRAGFAVLAARDAREALALALSRKPDLVISDVHMDGNETGVGLCAELRRRPRTRGVPFLLMSGLSRAEVDQVAGLETGADDYLLKPFTNSYLVAKARALLRRCAAAEEAVPDQLSGAGVSLDKAARSASIRGRVVRLTRKEFDLLAAFLEKPGRLLTPRFLLESVWGYDLADYNDTHTVTSHLYSLRRKLGAEFGRRIVTVPGSGYRFEPAPRRGRAKI